MSNSETFLLLFNQLEEKLLQTINRNEYLPFNDAVDEASEESILIRNNSYRLKSFGRLRNAIVHNPRGDAQPIADPHAIIVNEIKNVLERLNNPILVGQHFLIKVFSVTGDDKVSDVVSKMVQNDFSQVPVIRNNVISGLVTQEQFFKGFQIQNFSNKFECMDEFLLFLKQNKLGTGANHKIISRFTDVYYARKLFVDSLDKGEPLDALIITHNGKSSEKPIGMISRSDDLGRLSDLVYK